MLDVSALPKFGNITKNAGLAGVFDGNTANVAYNDASTGFAGVHFSSSPKRIGKVEIVAASNGFDCSGLESPVAVTVRAKNGGGTPGMNDGTVIGRANFKDVNAAITKAIETYYPEKSWDYVWLVLQTGVWVQLCEVRLFEPPILIEPDPQNASVAIYQRACNFPLPLPQSEIVVPGFAIDLAVCEASVANIDFAVNVSHIGDLFDPPYTGAIGIGGRIVFKHASTFSGLETAAWQTPNNSRANGINIDDRNPAHYANVSLNSSMALEEGFYRFSLAMSAHTDGDSRDGLATLLAEGGKGLNGFRVTVFKGAEFRDLSA